MMKNLYCLLLVLILSVSVQARGKITIFVPNENVESSDSLANDSTLSVHLWCSQMSSPKIFTVFMQISCTDSVQIEFTSPILLSKKGKQSFDAVTVSAIDTLTGVTTKIDSIPGPISIPGGGEGVACKIPAGSYKLQFMYFLDYRPKLKGTVGKTQLDLGKIIFNDEVILLNSIDVIKTKDKDRKSDRYPNGSRVR